MKRFLSIVIPVYNVEVFVEKCIRSCFAQNVPLDTYEVIVVNDGATDNSLAICESLQLEFPQIKIISQENKGLSGARNTGMRYANGDYIWFVDSDDWIEKNCLKAITDSLTKSKPDLMWTGHDVLLNNKVVEQFIPTIKTVNISGNTLFMDYLDEQYYIWKFIYRKEFLTKNHLEFYEGILYEDVEFTPRALFKARSCIVLSEICYHYLLRKGSIVGSVSYKNVYDRFFVAHRLLNYIQENKLPEKVFEQTYCSITKIIIGTYLLGARNKINLPNNGNVLVRKIKFKNYFTLKLTLLFIPFKISPIISYYSFLYCYSIYKKIF